MDQEEAVRLFRRSAAFGSKEAEKTLGWIYNTVSDLSFPCIFQSSPLQPSYSFPLSLSLLLLLLVPL